MKTVSKKAVMAPFLFLWLVLPINALCSPIIEVQPHQHSFGDLQEGPPATTAFEIRNTGDEDLHIKNVHTSCGCTAAMVGKRCLSPGEKTRIKVTYRTAGRPGPFKKTISIESDDPTNPDLLLKINGNVIARPAPLLFLPHSRVVVPSGPSGSLANFSLFLTNRGQKPLEIRRIVSRDGRTILWAQPLTIPPGKNLHLPLHLVRPAEHFRLLKFRVESNDPRRPAYYFGIQEGVNP
ncbi:MAG: DUF1573 domain-containing protein [Deltaproteobacteria bacterium]|nr:DUF1573 domain-containing protein [Deltaproteobacteria bacterium]MBW1947086.1 DUF1573 domain-containing protein [Deltaproteobacteria bacterium]